MMKGLFIWVLLIVFYTKAFAQYGFYSSKDNVVSLDLNQDGTFQYVYDYHLSYLRISGVYKKNADTITLINPFPSDTLIVSESKIEGGFSKFCLKNSLNQPIVKATLKIESFNETFKLIATNSEGCVILNNFKAEKFSVAYLIDESKQYQIQDYSNNFFDIQFNPREGDLKPFKKLSFKMKGKKLLSLNPDYPFILKPK